MERCEKCGRDVPSVARHVCDRCEAEAYARGRSHERLAVLDAIVNAAQLSQVVKSYIATIIMRGRHMRLPEQVLASAIADAEEGDPLPVKEALSKAEKVLGLPSMGWSHKGASEASLVYQAALALLVGESEWLGDLVVREDERGDLVVECSVRGGSGGLSSSIAMAARKWTKRGVIVRVKCSEQQRPSSSTTLKLVKS